MNSLPRNNPHKKFALRDPSNSDLHKIKNMYIHKAVQKLSPQGLPMDFDNRYKMESFKQGNNRPPIAIAPIGVHGAL